MNHFINGCNDRFQNIRHKNINEPRNNSIPFGGIMKIFEEQPFDDHFIRCRGLPWNCKYNDIEQFFKGKI